MWDVEALPQVREVAWLYLPGSDIPTAGVRLEERMSVQEPGWDLLLNDPAREPTKRAPYADEESAREALAAIYAQGEQFGRWKVRRAEAG